MTFVHRPVLLEEVVEGLALKPGAVVVDATLGLGGHSERMLQAIGPDGRLLGLDRDREALAIAKERLAPFGERVVFFYGGFGEFGKALDQSGLGQVDAVLFDLGVSSMQLEKGERGFSFSREGPLDMRMDADQETTAAHFVNHASMRDLEEMIRSYGEERWAGRIAGAIMRSRPFVTTTQLADVIRGAVPGGRKKGKIDAATRTFQAIRIAVNEELEQLASGLSQAVDRLAPFGRIGVLSYHSLEDRAVKQFFREKAQSDAMNLITRKPIVPSDREVQDNPRSRSAHLRIAEKAE